MFKSRVNRKTCPHCNLTTPVASKSCSNEVCEHAFVQPKHTGLRLGQTIAQKGQLLRRTERVRRRNPKFNNFETDDEKENNSNAKGSKRSRSFAEEEQPKPKRVRRKIISLCDVRELDKNKNENSVEVPIEALSQEIAQQTIAAITKKSIVPKPKPKRRRRARNLKNNRKVPRQNGGGDKCALLSKEKQELAALFLSEINRKMGSVACRF